MLTIFLKIILLLTLSTAAYAETPAGYWKTIDDVTHQPESILKITETPDHTLSGYVIKNLSAEKAKYKFCSECKGKNHNQPIIGMEILWGLQQNGNEWTNGRILDPTSGKTYRCKIKLIGDGKLLRIRGYIGVPILGRTQIWVRTFSANA